MILSLHVSYVFRSRQDSGRFINDRLQNIDTAQWREFHQGRERRLTKNAAAPDPYDQTFEDGFWEDEEYYLVSCQRRLAYFIAYQLYPYKNMSFP